MIYLCKMQNSKLQKTTYLHHLLFLFAIIVPSSQFHTSPRPLYDLIPSPPAVSAAVATSMEPTASEIPAKGRKQSQEILD